MKVQTILLLAITSLVFLGCKPKSGIYSADIPEGEALFWLKSDSTVRIKWPDSMSSNSTQENPFVATDLRWLGSLRYGDTVFIRYRACGTGAWRSVVKDGRLIRLKK